MTPMNYPDIKIQSRKQVLPEGICRMCGEPTDHTERKDKNTVHYWHPECLAKITKLRGTNMSAYYGISDMKDTWVWGNSVRVKGAVSLR